MRPKEMKLVNVVDVEATCWSGSPPEGETSEVIQIGLAVVNLDALEVSHRKGFLITPSRSSVSEYCTRLTGLTQEQLAHGGTAFGLVCEMLRLHHGCRDRLWVSYGDYDRGIFERQCADLKIPYPFGRRHLNIKTLASMVLALDNEVGMDRMLERLRLPLAGTHHNAYDDAYNIAQIFIAILSMAQFRARARGLL